EAVAADSERFGGDERERDLAGAGDGFGGGEGFLQERAQLDRRGGGEGATILERRELEELFHDGLDARGLGADVLEKSGTLRGGHGVGAGPAGGVGLGEEFGGAADGGERGLDLVGEALGVAFD